MPSRLPLCVIDIPVYLTEETEHPLNSRRPRQEHQCRTRKRHDGLDGAPFHSQSDAAIRQVKSGHRSFSSDYSKSHDHCDHQYKNGSRIVRCDPSILRLVECPAETLAPKIARSDFETGEEIWRVNGVGARHVAPTTQHDKRYSTTVPPVAKRLGPLANDRAPKGTPAIQVAGADDGNGAHDAEEGALREVEMEEIEKLVGEREAFHETP